ncbi:MAG TPA: PQQ-binding-like beta-propeller repeat protein, partial [Urbifossiella sp.]|nr:PQQ-binding-like beta-propeller repeat protein [Urbifossiella sp.]
MSTSADTADAPAGRWPVRVWPGLVILAVCVLLWVVPPVVAGRTLIHFAAWFAAPLLGAVAAIIWWTFAARVRGTYRWLVPTLVLVPGIALAVTLHKGAEVVALYGLMAALVVWTGWLAVSVPLPAEVRQIGLVTGLAGLWVLAAMVRLEGTDADLIPTFRWRWQQSEEERYLAERATTPAVAPAADVPPVAVDPGDWPEFRGLKRDGLVTGAKLDPDWAARPPKLEWKHRIGPGWGSFAVVGGKLFTQEQLGAEEAVVCYDAATGAAVWEYKTPARFSESLAGPGPRATPTVHGGKVYAQGATGKVVRLDAATGKPEWTADVVAAGGVLPQWGFAASPLVTDGVVIVYAGGGAGKGTAAFKADTGALAWTAGNAKHGYSSAHPATFGGVPQVLMLSDYGLESFRPADGAKLWEHVWTIPGVQRSTQPTVLSATDVVIGTGVGGDQGVRRLRVTKAGDGWDVKTVWSSRGVKPYFNDGVVIGNHLYGFDDDRFCCVDLETGRQAWKETGYGHGQVV